MDPHRIKIQGPHTATIQTLDSYIPPDVFDKTWVKAYIRELSRVCGLAKLDRAVLFAQSAEETSRWRSVVFQQHHNPAGMFNLLRMDYMTFRTPQDAARAHVIQMCGYVYGECPHLLKPYLRLAPRFELAVELHNQHPVRFLSDLGAGYWAEDPNYANNIVKHYTLIINGKPHVPIITIPGCPNQGLRTVGSHPAAIVYHLTNDAAFSSTKNWFMRPGSDASAHFVIDRDGMIYQFVLVAAQAWTNNDVRSPRVDIPLLDRFVQWTRKGFPPYSVNDWTISIEHVCLRDQDFTEAQYTSTIALSKKLLSDWKITPKRGTMLRHSDINSLTRGYCPGPQFDLRRVILACGGDPNDMGV